MNKKTVYVQVQDEKCIPCYATAMAAGADVRACINNDIVIMPQESALIPTGFNVEIPQNFEMQIRPRSGLALKHSLSIVNSPATIDADYRGEIKVILINHGKEPFVVKPKMRIAQLVLAPVFQAEFVVKDSLNSTLRGQMGFGHTGES